jgi:hypothetical protein
VAKLPQVLLKHSKVGQRARITALEHLNAISFENWFHLTFDSIDHMLRMNPGAVVVLEGLA